MQVSHHQDGAKCCICPYDTLERAALRPVSTVPSIHEPITALLYLTPLLFGKLNGYMYLMYDTLHF